MIALLAVFVGSLPSSSVANENHLACLNDAKDDEAALSVCIEKMGECFSAGDSHYDYPPQTACYKGYSNAVLEFAKDLKDRLAVDPTNSTLIVKAAALRYNFRTGEARCDFLDETARRGSKISEEWEESDTAMCYANAHSLAYWIVIVNNRLR